MVKKVKRADGVEVEVQEPKAFGDVENPGEIVFVQRKVRKDRFIGGKRSRDAKSNNVNNTSSASLFTAEHIKSDVTLPDLHQNQRSKAKIDLDLSM